LRENVTSVLSLEFAPIAACSSPLPCVSRAGRAAICAKSCATMRMPFWISLMRVCLVFSESLSTIAWLSAE
jgi:hypothetical protein